MYLYILVETETFNSWKTRMGQCFPASNALCAKKKRLCPLVVQARVVDGQGLVCKADITGVHHQYTSTDAYVWDADKSRYSVALPFYGFRHRGGWLCDEFFQSLEGYRYYTQVHMHCHLSWWRMRINASTLGEDDHGNAHRRVPTLGLQSSTLRNPISLQTRCFLCDVIPGSRCR